MWNSRPKGRENQMTRRRLPVSEAFRALVAEGHIQPVENMEDMRLPGEYIEVPTITTYGTMDGQQNNGLGLDAELEQHTQRDFPPQS